MNPTKLEFAGASIFCNRASDWLTEAEVIQNTIKTGSGLVAGVNKNSVRDDPILRGGL